MQEMKENTEAKGVLGDIVGLAIAAIFLGSIFITGVQTLVNANTSGLNATELVIYGILSVIVILAAIILVLKYVGVKL